MSKQRFPWRSLFVILVAIAAVAITVDVRRNGSFKRSWTGKTLRETGALALWHDSLAKITLHSNRANLWLQANAPKYLTSLKKNIGPYWNVAQEKVVAWSLIIWESLLPARQWINKTVPPIIDNVLENYVPVAVKYLNESILAVRRLAVDAGLWIQANVLTGALAPENILRVLGELVGRAQVMSLDAYKWISNQVLLLTN